MLRHRKSGTSSRPRIAAGGAAFVCALIASGFVAAPAHAAGIGPEIAYSTWGTRPAVYLVNPDGSGRRLLYTGPRNSRIGRVDMKPGGGEVSFYENFGNLANGPAQLKTVTYAATGKAGVVTRSVEGCNYSIDYHPSDGSLLMVACSLEVQTLAAGSSSPTLVASTNGATRARWLSSGTEFVYSAAGRLRRGNLAAPENSYEVMAITHEFFSTAHTSNHALATDGTRIDRLDIDAGTVAASALEIGECPHFSPDDTLFLYMANGGSELRIRPAAVGSSSTPIPLRANFSSADWRN